MRIRFVAGPTAGALPTILLSLAVAALLLLAAAPALAARRPLPIAQPASPTPSATPTASATPSASATPTASPTGAVEPEPTGPASGLVFDGVLAVRVLTSDLLPLARANVTLRAFPATGAAFAARAVTDRSGTATLSHLPRTVSGTALLWVVNVTGTQTTRNGDCTTTIQYRGSIDVVARGGARAVPVMTHEVHSSQACAAQPSRAGSRPRTAAPAHNGPPSAGGGVSGGPAARNPTLTPPATTTEPGTPVDQAPMALLLVGFGLLSASALLTRPRRR